MRILCETIFVAWRAAADVDIIALSHAGSESPRAGKNAGSIVCETRTVDIKTCENLRYGLVETKDDLNVAVRILRNDSDSVASSNRPMQTTC